MTLFEIHKIIRAHAEAQDCRYRITKTYEVHFFGKIPNSTEIGWYFFAHDAEAIAADIQVGKLRSID